MKFNLLKTMLVAFGMVAGTSVATADEITATLTHTASSSCDETAGNFTSTVDDAKEHLNNTNFNGAWAGAAYAEFAFEIPEGQAIESATLSWSGVGSSKDRTTDVMYVDAGLTLNYTNEGDDALGSGTAKVNLAATQFANVSFPKNKTTSFTTDVTDAVKTIAASQNYIIFKFTNNAGGGDLVGKGADANVPVLVITTVDASAQTTYTVKFIDATGTELKEAATYDVLIGDNATASADDMATFTAEDGTMYIYESGNETIKAVEDATANVITLVFRKAAKYSYTLVSNLGTTLAEGSNWEGSTFKVPYPGFIEKDGTLYSITQNDKNVGYFLHQFTLNEDNQVETINYTKGINGIVFLAEAENIEGLTVSPAANSDIRCSNGLCAYNAGEGDAVITTLPAGKYKLYTSVWGNAGTEFIFKAGEKQIHSISSAGYIVTNNSEEFTLYTETDITLGATDNGTRGIDYVYIVKTGEATVAASVNDYGFATFCPTVGVSFAGVENVEAYKAAVDVAEGVVNLTKVETVAAGEGVLLRSVEGGAANVELALAPDAEANAGNEFIGATEDIPALATDADGKTNYILNNGSLGVGFYLAAGQSVAAGKAYLAVEGVSAAKTLKVVFGGDTTGISEVNATKADGAYYSVSGVRVANPTKGLYIMNGKKVIVK